MGEEDTIIEKLEFIRDEKLNKIIPENIKSGVNILNVAGALSPSEDLDAELTAQEQKLAELEAMVENKTGGANVKLNIYAQTTEPTSKDGIWLNTNLTFNNIIRRDNILIEPPYIVKCISNNSGSTVDIVLPSWMKQDGYSYLFISYPLSSSNGRYFIFISKGTITVNWNGTYLYVYGSSSDSYYTSGNSPYSDIPAYIRNLTSISSLSKGNASASINFNSSDAIYSCSVDIYKTDGTLRFAAPTIDTFEPNTLVLVQSNTLISVYNAGVYRTKLMNVNVVEGGIETYFNDVVLSNDNGEVDKTIMTYYGDGTQWIKFKN